MLSSAFVFDGDHTIESLYRREVGGVSKNIYFNLSGFGAPGGFPDANLILQLVHLDSSSEFIFAGNSSIQSCSTDHNDYSWDDHGQTWTTGDLIGLKYN